MTESKTYLNVPFAQKDAAKALGARWDATYKKWYVPLGKDIALFAQWHESPNSVASNINGNQQGQKAKVDKTTLADNATGVMTYAADKNFVAYSGDQPPWD